MAFAANVAAFLKEYYTDKQDPDELRYGDHPFLGRLRKAGDTNMVGKQLPVPIQYSNPQGVAVDFTNAQANRTDFDAEQFLITAGDYHGVVRIKDKDVRASRNNRGAFLSTLTVRTNGLNTQMGDELSRQAWSNGGNAAGRRASASTNVITLATPSDARNFEKGMAVVASDNDGSVTTHTLRAGGTTVAAVNTAAGTVTLTDASAITSFADNDYLFREGDFYGDQGAQGIVGARAFITDTDVPAALWGVSAATRLLHVQRWSGFRVASTSLTGLSMEDRIRKLGAQMAGRAKTDGTGGIDLYMHPEDWEVLEGNMSSRGVRPTEDDETQFGYMKIDALLAGRRVKIFADPHVQRNVAFYFRMEDWWLSSIGDFIFPQVSEGKQAVMMTDSTEMEYRLISYPCLACKAPRNQGRVTLS